MLLHCILFEITAHHFKQARDWHSFIVSAEQFLVVLVAQATTQELLILLIALQMEAMLLYQAVVTSILLGSQARFVSLDAMWAYHIKYIMLHWQVSRNLLVL